MATLFVLGRWPAGQMWGAVVFGVAVLSFAGWLVGLRAEGRHPGVGASHRPAGAAGRRVVVLTAGVAVLLDAVTGQELHVLPLPETADSWHVVGSKSGLVVTGHIVLLHDRGAKVLALDMLAGRGPVNYTELPGANCRYQQVFAPAKDSVDIPGAMVRWPSSGSTTSMCCCARG